MLFYIKMTYFVSGIGALAVAIVICPDVRAHWRSWTVIGILLIANAVAPYSHPYINDLLATAAAGGVKSNYVLQVSYFPSNGTEHALYVGMVAAAVWLWWRREAPVHLPLAAAFLVVTGWLLLSQNSQWNGVALSVVVALMLYDVLRRRQRQLGALPLVFLILPGMWIVTAAASVAGHYFKTGDPTLTLVHDTNLRGLVVPTEQGGLLAAFARGQGRTSCSAARGSIDRAMSSRPTSTSRRSWKQHRCIPAIRGAPSCCSTR